jgi:hypothetical protein
VFKSHLLAAGVLATVVAATQASPVEIGFFRVTNNAAQNVESQFSCVVADAGTFTYNGSMPASYAAFDGFNKVSFTFTNSAEIYCAISEIYFDDGTLLVPDPTFISNDGTEFNPGASPSNLPGGGSVGFESTLAFNADAQGNPELGVDGLDTSGVSYADSVTLTIILQAGKAFGDTIAALSDGGLRLGLHVRAIGGQSDSFVTPIPLPAGSGMATAGLLTLGGVGYIRRRKQRLA